MSEMGARDLRLWAKEEMAAAIMTHTEEIAPGRDLRRRPGPSPRNATAS